MAVDCASEHRVDGFGCACRFGILGPSVSGCEKETTNPEQDEPSDSSLVRANDPAEEGSSESNDGKLQEALSLSGKPDNDVYLKIHEKTLGEECKYGELLNDLQPGFQNLQLTADLDVQKLGSPAYDLGEMCLED